MDTITVMQGDQYNLKFHIVSREQTLTDDDLDVVEIVIGSLRKTPPGVAYNADTGLWEFLLTQSDSMSLDPSPAPIQLRAKFPDGSVIGRVVGTINVIPALSKEVL